MLSRPAFSVILPVFNGGRYLQGAIASVLAQTCTDFELILIDDGSTDDAVNQASLVDDPRLTILRQPNAGAPAALNAGIAAAKADLLAFIDCDDLWAPEKLEVHARTFAKHPEADVTFTGLIYIDAEDRRLGLPARHARGPFQFNQLFVDYVIGSTSSIAIRKNAAQVLGGFDPAFPYLFDVDLVLRAARMRRGNVFGSPEPLVMYRRRPGQQTSDWRIMEKYWNQLLSKYHFLTSGETSTLESRANMNMSRYFSYIAYERDDFSKSWSLLMQSFRSHPLRFALEPRNWKLGLACGSGLVLPPPLYRWLVQLAGLRPSAPAPVQLQPLETRD